jgi:beta-galactosidase
VGRWENSPGGSSTGHVIGGTAWYRKHFTLDQSGEGKVIRILFDWVYMNADLWVNGNHLLNHPNGYTAFSWDLTPYLNPPAADNILAVQSLKKWFGPAHRANGGDLRHWSQGLKLHTSLAN